MEINYTNTEGISTPITAEQLASWWAMNPDEEALETEIVHFIKARHAHPERYYFVLLEYSPDLNRIQYKDIESLDPLPEDWWVE